MGSRTEFYQLLPVCKPKMVLEGVVPGPRAHLASTTRGPIVARPVPFDFLAICAPDAGYEVKGELVMSFFLVRIEVILGNDVPDRTGGNHNR